MPDTTPERLQHHLAACARGESQGLERLYRATSAHLYAQLLRIVRQEAAAQDCLQQVYLRIWQSAGQYDASRAKPMTWMSTLTRNIGIDWLRRQRGHLEDGDDAVDFLYRESDMAAASDLQQQRRALHECLELLSTDQRRVMEKAYFEDLTHAELAATLTQPLGTIKSWIRRGLERLRACMSPGT